MPIGVQLSKLIADYRAETRTNSAAIATQASDEGVRVRLRRTQELLWNRHFWPHLAVRADIDLVEGERFYTWPADLLDFDGVQEVWFRDAAGDWHDAPLPEGIAPSLFNHYDSEADPPETCSEIYRWQYIGDQLEVWPVPDAAAAGMLRLLGNRPLRPLLADDDVCDLDSNLLVLFQAAEDMADSSPRESQGRQAKAQELLDKLLIRSDPGSSTRVWSMSPRANRGRGLRKNKDYVPTGA